MIKKLAPKPSERASLLKRYFEPTAEERENDLKVPTAAHKSIVRLVGRGYVKVIITTNFDRLLEKALQSEGITPFVVSSADNIKGMMHSRASDGRIHK